MIRRMLCIALAAAFLPLCASASDLSSAIAALPDTPLMELYSVVVLEMYQRGLSPDDIIAHVEQQQQAPAITHAAAPTHSVDIPLQDVLEYAQNAASSIPYTETFTTYDPPATPHPTYRAMAVFQSEDTVWISDKGQCYHTTPDCSGMKNPSGVSLSSAIASGRTACRDCAWWMVPEEE